MLLNALTQDICRVSASPDCDIERALNGVTSYVRDRTMFYRLKKNNQNKLILIEQVYIFAHVSQKIRCVSANVRCQDLNHRRKVRASILRKCGTTGRRKAESPERDLERSETIMRSKRTDIIPYMCINIGCLSFQCILP